MHLRRCRLCKTLVGEIDERNQLAGLNEVRDLTPLLLREVQPGRVVATAMQTDSRSPSEESLECLHHCFEPNAVAVGVVVRIERAS